jgi:hypothetical protein
MCFYFFIFRPVTSRPAGKYEAAFQEAFERKLSERTARLNAACQKYEEVLHWQAGGTCHTTKSLQSTEYRAVSGVFQKIDPPPLQKSECVLTPHQRGVHTHRAVRGVGGQYFGRRQTLDWPLRV